MAEYIDKQKLIDNLEAKADMVLPVYKPAFSFIAKMLQIFPKADVAPVRHGRWKLVGADKRGRGGEWECMADGCGKLYPYKCAFCPNCGARMDLGGADNGE